MGRLCPERDKKILTQLHMEFIFYVFPAQDDGGKGFVPFSAVHGKPCDFFIKYTVRNLFAKSINCGNDRICRQRFLCKSMIDFFFHTGQDASLFAGIIKLSFSQYHNFISEISSAAPAAQVLISFSPTRPMTSR